MIICNGDGEMFIDIKSGEIFFLGIGSPAMSFYASDSMSKSLESLAFELNVDIVTFPDMECHECPNYSECLQVWGDDEFDNTYCMFVDNKKTSKAIMRALSSYVKKCPSYPKGLNDCIEDEDNRCMLKSYCQFLQRD